MQQQQQQQMPPLQAAMAMASQQQQQQPIKLTRLQRSRAAAEMPVTAADISSVTLCWCGVVKRLRP